MKINNYKLILLNDGRNILVSDELTNIQAQEIEHYQTNDKRFFKIIAGTERTPTLTYSDEVKQLLRDKYGRFDIEKELYKEIKSYRNSLENDKENEVYKNNSILIDSCFSKSLEIIENKFKAHQSITNKRFSLEDMLNIYKEGYDDCFHKKGEWRTKYLIDKLQQPIQLIVEVEVEQICKNCGDIDCIHAICRSQIAKYKGFKTQPKITNNSILITKIL